MTVTKRRSKESLYANEKHKILREVYRHYFDFRDAIARGDVDNIIEYAVETEEGSGIYAPINISFTDLKDGLNDLAPRKREAFFYNVVLDWKQKDVAERMGITTVSVGQYVEAAMIQLAKNYFAEDPLLNVHEPSENT